MKTFLLIVLSAELLGGQASPDLKFEVASVRPSRPLGPERVDIGVHLDGAQVRIVSFSLRDYVARAYQLRSYQIAGPDWIASERFDLTAKFPEGSNADRLPEMLQSLLAERFQMKVHREKRELPVYALTLGKAPLKIQKAAQDGGADLPAKGNVNVAATGSAAGVSVDLGNGSYYTFANGKFEAKKVSMEVLARQLERYLDRPIVEMTGIQGNYDLSVTVTPEDAQTMIIRAAVNSGVNLPPQALQLLDNGSTASLLDGLQQLGLKLEARKAPLDVVVVDQASKTPTEN
jgi:uncharacterized protein (TIGR03435 family)